MFDYFQNNRIIQKYEGDLAIELFNRRMIHMAAMDFDTLILQESRKMQGIIAGTKIHINCQPLRDSDDTFMDIQMLEIGEISCVICITDDQQGMFSPAYYGIEVLSIVDGIFNDVAFKKDITVLLSFIGAFSQSFKNGDRVFVEGKLVRIVKNEKITFGIELSPWNTNRTFKAILLR